MTFKAGSAAHCLEICCSSESRQLRGARSESDTMKGLIPAMMEAPIRDMHCFAGISEEAVQFTSSHCRRRTSQRMPRRVLEEASGSESCQASADHCLHGSRGRCRGSACYCHTREASVTGN
eukprot:gb/GFBE01030629.1/.p1 GENE.gb/GFBE01030629.1/~~gb/GFBE01030629.1/.p1  ORF type:complete len:121 (+),score=10.09 gb/GFBE01030629.1/:1-363(+)